MNKLKVILAVVYLVSGYFLFLWGWDYRLSDQAMVGIGVGIGLIFSGVIVTIKLINSAIKQIDKNL